MSIHSSLRSKGAVGGAVRNVMKRFERVRHMMEKGTWTEGRSVYGLPKIKQIKLKARKGLGKEKEEASPEASATEAKAAS